jgi:hypothetical protein
VPRIELITKGAWADVREPEQLTEKGRRSLQRAISHVSAETQRVFRQNAEINGRNAKLEDGQEREPLIDFSLPDQDFDALLAANDACVLAMVTAWSFDGIPIDLEHLSEIPADDYDFLQLVCAPAIARTMIPNRFAPTKADLDGERDDPFGGSSGSGGSTAGGPSLATSPPN